MPEPTVTRQQLIEHLNEDLSREYQAIIAYVVYSQVLKGAQYMSIAKELGERVRQCEALEEYAIAEDIREILRQGQEHQTDLATALGEDVPDVSAAKLTMRRAEKLSALGCGRPARRLIAVG